MDAIDWSEGPVAVVSGAASGIGAAVARALAGKGARVAVLDVDEEGGPRVAEEIRGRFFHLDVRQAAGWGDVLTSITSDLGPVALAHLNAGVMTLPGAADLMSAADLPGIEDAAYRRVVGVNMDGVFFGLRALARALGQRGGRIVVTASTGGLTPVTFDPLYSMTKHAVVGLVRSAAPALLTRGISLAAICPAGVDTPLVPKFLRSFDPPLLDPVDVARAVVRLLESCEPGGIYVVRPAKPEPELVPEPDIELT